MAEKALSLRPTSLWTIDQAAQIHFWVRNYGRVIEILEKAIAEEPAFSRVVHMSLGVTYSGLEQYDKAIEHHLRAIEIDPLDIDSYKSLGETYYHFKDWQKAADTFKKVIELQPEDAWAYQWLGMVVGILGQTEQEKAYYQRATEIMPIQRLELGCWYLNYGDYPTAVTELIRAEKDRPNYPNNSFYLFTAQFLTGDYTGAEQSLSEWLNRLHYEDREALRGQAFPDGVVDRSSLVRYIRLILERFKAEKRPMLGRYEARLPATFYCLIGDYESAIQTLEYAYENFPVRAYYLPWYIRWIYFRPLHSDPRFWEIVRKMKLMPYFNKDNLPYINQEIGILADEA
jgi:tetratricopeptide (TPR) repeat protein